jgi:EipB-like
MTFRHVRRSRRGIGAFALLALAATLPAAIATPAWAVDIAPHRALYSMTLGSAKTNSGVVGARGTMIYEWGETCDGWTVEQRYKLNMQYAESSEVEVTSNFVTWESKDGLRYRFNERKLKNGEVDEEVRGEARLDGPDKPGIADFSRPETKQLKLAAGTMFPTAHTVYLIERAQAGESFLVKNVFDGSGDDNAVEISAVIGGKEEAEPVASSGPKSPLLLRPSWRVRLAFFPSESHSEKPEYELGMRLLDNGVSRDMTLDYGDFAIRAKLDEIEALPKPNC